MSVEPFQFIEHVLLAPGSAVISEVLYEALRRVADRVPAPDVPALHVAASDGHVRIDLVRRLSTSEITSLGLEPSSGIWYEVRGSGMRQPVRAPAPVRRSARRGSRQRRVLDESSVGSLAGTNTC